MHIEADDSGDFPVLVIGDSWTRFRRLDGGIRAALSSRGFRPRLVSVGLSGCSAGEIAAALPGHLPQIRSAAGGRAGLAVLMAGVNDAVRHLGPRRYARNLVALSELAAAVAERVLAVELPPVRGDIAGPLGRIKHQLYRVLFDGPGDTIATYRAALARTGALDILPVDPFFPAAFKDGVHLTDQEYARFAAYLGEMIARRLPLRRADRVAQAAE
jgi:lysophospholipase L1-like esterase